MPERAHLRTQHLRRLTDRIGLLHRAGPGGEPDRFAGYDTVENARALHLTTQLHAMGLRDDAAHWAQTYLQFLFQAFRDGRGFCAQRAASGNWSDDTVSPRGYAEIAAALAAAAASTLPGILARRADTLLANARPDLHPVRCPRAAAAWLIAFAHHTPAEQRKHEEAANKLARSLVEDRYYPLRSADWEWFDEWCLPCDALLPHGLWAAYTILGEERYARVARATTRFLIENLFEDGLLLPVGTDGGWPRHGSRAMFDQDPRDVTALAQLLATAADTDGDAEAAEYARFALAWFTGNNVKGLRMLDDTTGGVYDALTRVGHADTQSAAAILSYLAAVGALRNVQSPASPIVDMGTVVALTP
jgi:uncharacterized protein YyaL (SSP411 family)